MVVQFGDIIRSLDAKTSLPVSAFDVGKGSVVVVHGGFTNYGSGSHPVLKFYSSEGSSLWELEIKPAPISFSPAAQPRCDVHEVSIGDDAIYVGGRIGNGRLFGLTASDSSDCFLAKISKGGVLQWAKKLGTSQLDDGIRSVDIFSDGSVITTAAIDGFKYEGITGYSSPYSDNDLLSGTPGANDALVQKWDSDGKLLWQKLVGTGATTHLFNVNIGADGDVFLYGNGQVPIFSSKPLHEGEMISLYVNGTAANDTVIPLKDLNSKYIAVQLDGESGSLVKATFHPASVPALSGINSDFYANYDFVDPSGRFRFYIDGKVSTGKYPASYWENAPLKGDLNLVALEEKRHDSQSSLSSIYADLLAAEKDYVGVLADRKFFDSSNIGYKILSKKGRAGDMDILFYPAKADAETADWWTAGAVDQKIYFATLDLAAVASGLANAGPESLALTASSFNENLDADSVIGNLSTTDPDPDDTFTYSLVSGDGAVDNAAFSISGDELLINSSPDYETKSSYSIRVRSTDQGGLSTEQVFMLNVNDVQEAPPAPVYTIDSVIDGSDIGEAGFGSGDYGLYRISGIPERNGSVLALTDADLEESVSIDSSTLSTPALPLLTAAGKPFPSTALPIAIRKEADAAVIELLYQSSLSVSSYQTQDFSLATGKAIGLPTAAVKSLQLFEVAYDQDLDNDGVKGVAVTVQATIDSADQGSDGDGSGTYGLYRISGINGNAASQLAVATADLAEETAYAQADLQPLLPLQTSAGKALPTAWTPLAIRQDGNKVELLYQPSSKTAAYQTQDFSLTTGKATGAATPLNRSLQAFEPAYDQDLDGDGEIGPTLTVQSVLDAADQGQGGDGLGTYGLYRIIGLNGSTTAVLVLADADLEEGQVVRQADLTTVVPLLTSAGKALPTTWLPLAIRQDGDKVELLYQPSSRVVSYQTQDFSVSTGKAIGAPTAAQSSLIPLEVAYNQDFNNDDVLGINIEAIGETNAIAGSAAKDRLTLQAMDIGYGGANDDTLLIGGSDFNAAEPITMIGGTGNDTYTAKAGAFVVVYDLGTTKDTKDVLTGLPGLMKQWSLYKVETNDYLLNHSATGTSVLLVDPLGKASAGNRLETIRFSSGAAQTMTTLTRTGSGILSGEPALSYEDLPDRFGHDIAFAYGISQAAGPLSIQPVLSSNLAMAL
jgi:hypothetical protein